VLKQSTGSLGNGNGNIKVVLPPHHPHRRSNVREFVFVGFVDRRHEDVAHHTAGVSVVSGAVLLARGFHALVTHETLAVQPPGHAVGPG